MINPLNSALIHRDWGGGDLTDLEAVAQHLGGLDWIDRNRIGVFGASYGGFAVLSGLSRISKYWACGVDINGPSNLVTLINSVPATWRSSVIRSIGDPETDHDALIARSPITHAAGVRAPLLVIQGERDPRVPKAESDAMVQVLRDRAIAVRYEVFPDEGHGFGKRHNEIRAMELAAQFLFTHLAAGGNA